MFLPTLILLAAALAAEGGAPAPEPPALRRHPGPLSKVLEEAKAKSRPVMIDFVQEGSPICRWMDTWVYADAEVVKACNDGFLVLRLDGGKGEGADLAKKHGVKGFPSVVFVDSGGWELDRGDGPARKPEFLALLRAVAAGDHMKALRARLEKDPKDAVAHAKVGIRLAGTGEDEAWDHIEKAIALDPADAHPETVEARFFLAALELGRDSDTAGLLAFAKKYPDHPRAVDAQRGLLEIAREHQDDDAQLACLEFLLKRAPDANIRNSLSWLLATQGKDLERALALVDAALKDEPKDPAYIDTRAECLSRLGRHDEAVAEQKRAVESLPADTPAKRRAEYEKRLEEFTRKRDAAKK